MMIFEYGIQAVSKHCSFSFLYGYFITNGVNEEIGKISLEAIVVVVI